MPEVRGAGQQGADKESDLLTNLRRTNTKKERNRCAKNGKFLAFLIDVLYNTYELMKRTRLPSLKSQRKNNQNSHQTKETGNLLLSLRRCSRTLRYQPGNHVDLTSGVPKIRAKTVTRLRAKGSFLFFTYSSISDLS